MADAWIYSRTRTDADDLSRALADLGFTPRHVDDGTLVPSGRDGAGVRRPELAAIVDRPALVRELRAAEELRDVPLLLVADARELPEPAEATLAHELVVRPFSRAELETRVARATRRHGPRPAAGDVELDASGRRVYVGGSEVELTYIEFELLRFLFAHPNRAFTRQALLNRVWGYDYYGGERTVDVHVQRVRAKLGRPALIRTVRNVGYLLDDRATAAAA